MARENVERLRWLYSEWARGNLWALSEIADPDIEWAWADEMASLFGGPRTYRGLDEIVAATLEWLAAWDRYWMTADDFIEAGDDVVVVLMELHARTADSETVVEQKVAAVWGMRDGKAVRVRYYMDRADALAAVQPGARGGRST
jgi:ketosteroid isomerase-like protein